MNFFVQKHNRPIVIAHRGAAQLAPENTMSAFVEAIRAGADALELDVQSSSDGVPIVMHDRNLRRTTQIRGRVSQYKLAELMTLDAGGWFGEKFVGENIPTLVEVLERLGDKTRFVIELKPYQRKPQAFVQAVFQIVNECKLLHRVLFLSFDPRILTQLKAIDSAATTCLAFFPVANLQPPKSFLRSADVIGLPTSGVSTKYLQKIRQFDRPINLWASFGKKEDFDKEINLKPQMITTNDPTKLRRHLLVSKRESNPTRVVR